MRISDGRRIVKHRPVRAPPLGSSLVCIFLIMLMVMMIMNCTTKPAHAVSLARRAKKTPRVMMMN